MNPRTRWLPVAGLCLSVVVLAACGGSDGNEKSEATPAESTPTTVPSAVLDPAVPDTSMACGLTDTFQAGYTETDTEIDAAVTVSLGEVDCPPGDVLVTVDMSRNFMTGTLTQSLFVIPEGEVQAQLDLCPDSTSLMCSSGRSLTVVFSADEIVKVTLTGNGDPVDLERG